MKRDEPDLEKKRNWPEMLDKIMFNLNTQHHSKTKTTPHTVMFNRKPNIKQKGGFIFNF